jgi:quercetin dioxygenase-like cupin family protein
MAEHLHPALHDAFIVLVGELGVMGDGRRSTLHAGQRAHIMPRVWHD